MSLWPITRLLVSSFEILSPAFNAANSNCCLFWGVSAFTLLFSWWNSCSIRFKSGDWLGLSKNFSFLSPYKFLDWTGRVFWVIVLILYEAFPNGSGGIFLNIARQNGLYPSKFILLLSSYIVISKVERACSRDSHACACHDTTSTMLFRWGCMLGIFCSSLFSPHFCFPIT